MHSLYAAGIEHVPYVGETQNRREFPRDLKVEWGGELAQSLGLYGEPTFREAINLAKGLSPDGRKQLLNSSSKVRVLDHVFSGPKSVSVLWAFSPPEWRAEIEECHKIAVRRVLRKIEKELVKVRRSASPLFLDPLS